ncbi:hypothetical protein BDV30DRAFT_241327 [Aspergillus minisclerotigenes]|uniref:Extracellular membrane protein CFEM domain-containing protein n=1 Tax=Aspergillus minisclerotigenes TaxID=656917 RepID=A0A5N6IW60_9EURO|nr:hypothetical protein BDV30DRAFT_241327 [Aspergillus minisclerotigenes]
MRFTTITISLLISLSSGALAASIPSPHTFNAPVLDKRGDCSCSCVDDCGTNCAAFGGTPGSQMAQGLCLATCGDSCGCSPTEVCNNKEALENICKVFKESSDVRAKIIGPYFCYLAEQE